jgi:hypothetical protein
MFWKEVPNFSKSELGGRTDTVTVDHLKPAHHDLTPPVQVAKLLGRLVLPKEGPLMSVAEMLITWPSTLSVSLWKRLGNSDVCNYA